MNLLGVLVYGIPLLSLITFAFIIGYGMGYQSGREEGLWKGRWEAKFAELEEKLREEGLLEEDE